MSASDTTPAQLGLHSTNMSKSPLVTSSSSLRVPVVVVVDGVPAFLRLWLLLLSLLLLAVAVAVVVVVLLRRAGPGSGLLPSSFLPSSVSLSFHLTRVSPTQLPSRTCSAICLAARQVLRRSLALRMWSIVNSDPPCISPPRHVSIRHIVIFLLLHFNAFFLRCHLFFFSMFFFSDFLARSEHSLLSLAPPEPLLLSLSPLFLMRLLRSPLFFTRLLRSLLFLFSPFVFGFFSLL